eukprot:Polyplicarium_translucidae@DN1926_c0_g1_i2.p1
MDATNGEKEATSRSPRGTPWVAFVVLPMIALGLLLGILAFLLLWVLFWPVFLMYPSLGEDLPSRSFRFFTVLLGVWLNPAWSYKIYRNTPDGYKPGRTVVMCNHVSGADPHIACAALWPWEFKWVYKADLRGVPFIGWALLMLPDLPVFFAKGKGFGTEKGTTAQMFNAARRSVARGRGVFVFPEGTRSRSGCLQQMRDGFFGFALKERCEILPMVLQTRSLWPLSTWFVRVGKAEIAFADPIDVAKLPEDETLDSLKARVQKAMLAALRTCPSYDTAIESRINETPTSRGGGLRG